MKLLPSTLRTRLLVVQLLSLALVWGAMVAYTLHNIYRGGEGALDQDLLLIATSTARLASAGEAVDAMRVGREIAALNTEFSDGQVAPAETAFQIWTRDGVLLARSEDAPRLRDLPPGTIPVGRSLHADGWVVAGAWNREGTVYAVSGQAEGVYGRIEGSLALSLGVPLVLLGIGLSVALAVSVGLTLAPLRRLAAEVERRAPDDLAPIAGTVPFAELRPFVGALNAQLARIRGLIEAERRFFADAAHELRTPLAVMSVQAHVMAHEGAPEARREALATLERGIERAGRVVARMLTMGRLQAVGALGTVGEHDLSVLATRVVDEQRERARARGSTLLLSGERSLVARFDPNAIAVALENLVDNALAYSPPGSTVVVGAARDGAELVLRVADDGPGIAPADRERAFERFERLDQQDTHGSGLGLAIVRRVAELHGGTASIGAPASGPGTVVEIRWPAAHAAG